MSTRDLINLGSAPDSGTGDSARRGGEKINILFADLYANFGDNPIGNDPNGANYGIRRPFLEHEYKVGELHPAGKFRIIKFKTTNAIDNLDGKGFGVDAAGAYKFNLGGVTVPDIYMDSEWYFMSRGEQVTLDLTDCDSDKPANIVLPLARPGDVVKIRDSFSTWNNKYINVWSTPFEPINDAQADAWLAANSNFTPNYFDSDSTSVSLPNGTVVAIPYKTPTLSYTPTNPLITERVAGYVHSSVATGNVAAVSPLYFHDKSNTEIEFIYRGPKRGWVYNSRPLDSQSENFNVSQDSFTIAEWVVWKGSDLTVTKNGAVEVEITQGDFVLGVMPTFKTDLKTTSVPVIKTFRKMNDQGDIQILTDIQAFFDSEIASGTLSTEQLDRVARVNGSTDFDGLQHATADTVFKEIFVPSIVDDKGNILLITNDPFDGMVQILAPAS